MVKLAHRSREQNRVSRQRPKHIWETVAITVLVAMRGSPRARLCGTPPTGSRAQDPPWRPGLCALAKSVCSAALAWGVPHLCAGTSCSMVLKIFKSSLSFIDLLSGGSTHYWKWFIKTPSSVELLFLPSILCHIVRCSAVRCAYLYNYRLFLENWPFYHYGIAFFVSCGHFGLRVYSVWGGCGHPCSLWFPFTCNIFSHPFAYRLYVSSQLTLVSLLQTAPYPNNSLNPHHRWCSFYYHF